MKSGVLIFSTFLVLALSVSIVSAGPLCKWLGVNCDSDLTGELYSISPVAEEGVREIHVTNLNENGPGSLKEALETPGERKVVFDVGGVIELSEHLIVTEGDLIIAGETAPYPGVILYGDSLVLDGVSNVEIRHINIFATNPEKVNNDDRSNDALKIWYTRGDIENIYVHHNSFYWARDETIEIICWKNDPRFPDLDCDENEAKNIVFERNIIGESLLAERGHAQGVLMGPHVKEVIFNKNLFTKNKKRNPKFSGDSTGLLVNNIIYNPQTAGIDVNNGYNHDGSVSNPTYISAVNNVVIPGRNSRAHADFIQLNDHLARNSKFYLSGNVFYGRGRDWGVIQYNNERFTYSSVDWRIKTAVRPTHPWMQEKLADMWIIPTWRTENIVLNMVGARNEYRIPKTKKILREVRTRRGRIISSPHQSDLDWLEAQIASQ